MGKTMHKRAIIVICLLLCFHALTSAQTRPTRTLSGIILTPQNEAVPGVSIVVGSASGEQIAESDAEGYFNITVPNEPLSVQFSGKNISPVERAIALSDASENLQIRITYVIPPVHASVVIEATTLDPAIDQRNDTVYKNTLFGRDDQLFQTLNAGINAGQHEGGGKSLEIRRFGFNLDHGGVNGGLKVLVDDVQQNQGTQGHGQGYLG